MPRPRKHASDAARVAAFRAQRVRLELHPSQQIAATLDELAEQFEVPRAEVALRLLRFALAAKNWKQFGLPFTPEAPAAPAVDPRQRPLLWMP